MENIEKTFDVIVGTRVLNRAIVLRARVAVPSHINAEMLRQANGFSFISIDNIPPVNRETLGRIVNLTQNTTLNYPPEDDTYGLRRLMLNALGDLIKQYAAME